MIKTIAQRIPRTCTIAKLGAPMIKTCATCERKESQTQLWETAGTIHALSSIALTLATDK